jgi:hypothetical protein
MSDLFTTETIAALKARSDLREQDMAQAVRDGEHFWLVMLVHRVTDPSAELILDTENLCGMVNVHCGICGAEGDSVPCPGI